MTGAHPGLVTLLVAACLAVVWGVGSLVNGLAHPRGQRHAGPKGTWTDDTERTPPPPWYEDPLWPGRTLAELVRQASDELVREPVTPAAIWAAPVHVLLPDMEVAERKRQVREVVEAGRKRFQAEPRPWGDDTGSFRAVTARDLGTPGAAS